MCSLVGALNINDAFSANARRKSAQKWITGAVGYLILVTCQQVLALQDHLFVGAINLFIACVLVIRPVVLRCWIYLATSKLVADDHKARRRTAVEQVMQRQ